MVRSLCTSCGLRRRRCQCRREASTAENANVSAENANGSVQNANADAGDAFKLTPISFCVMYFIYAFASIPFFLGMFTLLGFGRCHVEVFVDSVNVSAANANATADWKVGFVAKSHGCKASLHTINSRLLGGDKLISESFTPDYFGKLITGKIYEPLPYAVFKMVETPKGISGVIWDFRVEVVSSVQGVKKKGQSDSGNGFLFLTCGDIPVNFTADSTENVKGTLLGNMRPCEYVFQQDYLDPSF